jgi:uncharacterized membrane protein
MKIRPQILAGIISATLIGGMALWVGMVMGAVEVVTAVIGSVFGFLAGVSLKILESE